MGSKEANTFNDSVGNKIDSVVFTTNEAIENDNYNCLDPSAV